MKKLVVVNRKFFEEIEDTGLGSCKFTFTLIKDALDNYSVLCPKKTDSWINTMDYPDQIRESKKLFPNNEIVCFGIIEIQNRINYPGPSNVIISSPSISFEVEEANLNLSNAIKTAEVLKEAFKNVYGWWEKSPFNFKEIPY
ncbi:MAG: hypothetical protein U0469_01705 [Candidatus Paceibacterota bacterium]|jgi:hypothetical protein